MKSEYDKIVKSLGRLDKLGYKPDSMVKPVENPVDLFLMVATDHQKTLIDNSSLELTRQYFEALMPEEG